MFVVIKVILDGISCRISHVHARMVLGLLSGMIVMYYSLPMISCAQRIFQYFSPCMGVFGYGVDPIDLFSFHTLSSYLAVCAVVQCLLTGTVMHIHAYCLHITLEGGNVTHLHHCRACAVVAWVELRSFRICVPGRVAGFLRRLTSFRLCALFRALV